MPSFSLPVGRAAALRGFTMVELIVTLILVGILAVSVLPRFDLLRGYDAIGYRDALRATLEYARKAAVAQRRNVQVVVAANSISAQIASDVPEGSNAAVFDRPLNLPGKNTHTLAAPTGVTVSPTATIVFDPLGRPSLGGVFSVTGAGDVTLVAETGHVY